MNNVFKPACKMVGESGNVFAIIGLVARTLKQAGLPNRAAEWSQKAMQCASYDEVLRLVFDYVEPE